MYVSMCAYIYIYVCVYVCVCVCVYVCMYICQSCHTKGISLKGILKKLQSIKKKYENTVYYLNNI